MTKKKKKQNNPYKHSFAKRLTMRITLTLLIGMAVASFCVFTFSWAITTGETSAYCMEMLKRRVENVRRMLSDVYVASRNTVPEIEDNLNKPEKLTTIMERMVRLNPYIRSCGISFVESYYPQKGRWFCPYACRVDSTTVKSRIVGDAQHDYLTSAWFTEAMEAEDGYWSKPFFEDDKQEIPLVSYLIPIRNKQGQKVAVFGADLSLDWLSQKMPKVIDLVFSQNGSNQKYNRIDPKTGEKTKKYKKHRRFAAFFIIDNDGTFIAHPDQDRVIKENYFTYADATPDTIDNYLGHLMTAGYEGFFEKGENGESLILEGKKSFAFYMPIEHTNWSMALAVEDFDIYVFGYVVGGILIFLLIIALIIIYIVGHFIIKRAVKPVNQLAASANEVAKGHFDTPLPTLKTRDEIHMLRDSFDEMQQSLTRYVEELKTTTAQKASIESELKIAQDIQMSMLPKTFPPFPERSDIDVYGMLTPAKGVGGDLFDFYIRNERLFFCIGDVSGKGIPAALVMAVTRSLFRNISSYASEPDMIVFALNNALADGNDTNMFVTVFVGVLELQTGRLHYCNAGHDSPLLIGRDVSMLSCQPNLPAGVIPDYKFVAQEANINPQTTIFLYTDGLTEAEDAENAQFGIERIMNLANRLLAEGYHHPQHLITNMNNAVHDFVGDAEQSDDLTMLAIQYEGSH